MPIGSQPRRARGTIEHPYSALNLRLVLASVGVVSCGALTGLLFGFGQPLAAIVALLFALAAAVDLVIIQLRRRARHRVDPGSHSLFE